MFQWARKWLRGAKHGQAGMAVQLPEREDPKKLRPGARGLPTHMTSADMPDTPIAVPDARLASTDISRINRQQTDREILRELGSASPDLSAAISGYLRTAITANYTAIATNTDGTFNEDGTNLAAQILKRLNVLPDYTKGYAGNWDMRSMAESLGKELILNGAAAAELVLDKARLPDTIRPMSVVPITFKPKGDRLVPVQTVGGDEYDLDTPTFFYTTLDLGLQDVYPDPPFAAAIKPAFFSEKFMADLQRVVDRAVHPRLLVEVDTESLRKNAPPEALHEEGGLQDYYEDTIFQLQSMVQSLAPEDALVFLDTLKVDLLNNGNVSLAREWDALESLIKSKMATGAKTLPVVLGHTTGSSNIASAETLLFMKNAEGLVQSKLNDLFSKILTLAVRLYGIDCAVEFKYEPINLRPETELETFKVAKQSRVLELLSLGILTDEQASIELTGKLPRPDAPKLSGTFFKSKDANVENLYDQQSNQGSTLNQTLGGATAKGAQGQNNKANPVKEK